MILRAVALLVALGLADAAWAADTELADKLYRPWHFMTPTLSPSGARVASLVSEDGWLGVRVVEPATGLAGDVLDLDAAVTNTLHWVDDSTLAVAVVGPATLAAPGPTATHLVRIERGEDALRFTTRPVEEPGVLVHGLAALPDELLFASTENRPAVYRLAAGDLLDPATEVLDLLVSDARVARLGDTVVQWVVDARGEVRASLATDGSRFRIWYRRPGGGRFRKVLTWSKGADVDVIPFGVSADGERLLVATNRDRERWGLFELDPEESELGRLVFEHPQADVTGVLQDGRGTVVGTTYLEAGQVVYHYLGDEGADVLAALRSRYPDERLSVIDRSLDGRRVLGWVRSSSDPGRFVLLDLDTGETHEVGHRAPWLEDHQLASIRRLDVRAADGLQIEAFVALPGSAPAEAWDGSTPRPPLVVFPHGGPIGAFDHAEFQRGVQHLAAADLAVLQVNYRGSGGRGRTFLDAGRGEWGRGIEDDLDQALEALLAKGWVDPERICIAGLSYGGYSALMSVIRHPRRFRCAATSAGVTDIALMFTSSDFAVAEEGRREFARIVGDPATRYEELRARSPVYLAYQIEAPILVMHGVRDARVTVEHARRLKVMLDLYGKEYEWQLIEDMGHTFEDLEQMRDHNWRLVRFLRRHLYGSGDGVRSQPHEPVGEADHQRVEEEEAQTPER